MKKLLTVLLSVLMIFALAGCSSKKDEVVDTEPEVKVDYAAKSEGVMTYAEYAAAPADGSTEVVIEGYVQAVQSYWQGAKMYLQDSDGAYFVYCDGKGSDINISEEDYATLVDSTDYSDGWTGIANGAKVKVTGTKAEWSGEVEITDATVELVNDGLTWKAEAEDVTALLGTDELANHMNKLVKFTGLTVAPSTDADGNEVAFLYNWDGSGSEGSDLYYNVTDGTNVYQFVVESYLMYAGSPVYEAVKGLTVGATVDVEAFLYWYNGANPHSVNVVVK